MIRNLSTLILFISLFNFSYLFSQNTDDIVLRFTQEPSKKISLKQLTKTDYFIEYKSKKLATIYLSLMKGTKTYANKVVTIKSRKIKKIKMKLSTWGKVPASQGYTLNLFMYEGEKDNWKKPMGERIVIEKVSVSRL